MMGEITDFLDQNSLGRFKTETEPNSYMHNCRITNEIN